MRQAVICGVVALVLACCSGDPNEQANKLFVEGQQLIEKAEKQNPEEKLQTLLTAEEKLKTIVAKFSAANLAVQLVSEQSIGKISLSWMSEAVADAAWTVCLKTPKRACVLNQALQVAHSMGNEAQRAWPLGLIAATQLKVGLAKEATATLGEAVKAAQSINLEVERMALVRAIAGPLAKAGKIAEVLQIAQSIKDDEAARADALSFVAAAQAEAGKIQEAMQIAQSIKGEAHSYALVAALAEGGKTGEAMQLVNSITGEERRAILLSAIAAAQAKAGMIKEAAVTFDQSLQVARSIDKIRGGLLLQSMAEADAKRGRIAEAVRAAQSIEIEELRAPALRSIVEAQAKAGEITKALQLALSIKVDDDYNRNIALGSVAQAQGKIAEAMRLAQSIKNEPGRANALRAVAEALPN